MRPLPPVRPRSVAVVVGLVLAALAVLAGPASAHADLVASSPADGAVLATAPEEITLQFTEDVEVRADGVRVLDGEGTRNDQGAATSDGTTVTVPVDDLAEGSYVVAWRVVSADGHPVRGAFTFSVGRATTVGDDVANRAFGSGDDRAYEQLAAIMRIVSYATVLGAAGFVVVAGTLRRDDEPSPVGRGTTITSVAALCALALSVPAQAALVTGRGPGALTEPGVLGLALGEGFGVSILVIAAGLLAMIITAGLPYAGAVRRMALAGAVIATSGFVLSGHTRTMSPAVVGYAADLAHLWAAAVWFGGLFALVAVVRWRRGADDPFGAAEAVARFSGWAAVTVAALAVAGTAMGWIEVGSIHALTSTTYGRLLLAKVAVAAVVVAFGGWNRFKLLPRVAAAAIEEPPADDARAWRALVRVVRLEIVLLVGALALTGVLTNVTPAKDAVDPGSVSASAPLGAGTMDVTVDPADPGRNDIHVFIYDEDGSLSDRYDTATITLELPAQDLGPIETVPVEAAPGHFQLVGVDLPLAGTWELTVAVKPDRFSEQTGSVSFEIG